MLLFHSEVLLWSSTLSSLGLGWCRLDYNTTAVTPNVRFAYLSLNDLGRQPLCMAIGQVACGDSHLFPEQAQLEADKDWPRRELSGTTWSQCAHGEEPCSQAKEEGC